MCKKQTSVSHSSTESEIISLNAGLRLGGILALDSWDLIVSVLGNTTQNHDRIRKLVVCPDKKHVRHQSRGAINVLENVDLVPSKRPIFASIRRGVDEDRIIVDTKTQRKPRERGKRTQHADVLTFW